MVLNNEQEIFINNKLQKLSKSKFRQSFHLKDKDILYIKKQGLEKIESHSKDFINERLAPKIIENDGKQTPMKGHPVFIAQHATACCCRGCLEKWHHIPKGRGLTTKEQTFISALIMKWIENEYKEKENL